jgi:hypothetical protein
MRRRMLIFLFLLCLFLAAFFAGVVRSMERALEQEQVQKVVYEKWRFNKAFAGTAAIRLNAIGF